LRALAVVSAAGCCRLEAAVTGSVFGWRGLVCLESADVEKQRE
jgi:hypothetical protein